MDTNYVRHQRHSTALLSLSRTRSTHRIGPAPVAASTTTSVPAGEPPLHARTVTSAASVVQEAMQPMDAPVLNRPVLSPLDPCKVVTPLQADAWERELCEIDLFNTFQDVPYGIRYGFDLGVWQPILHTYTPPNHCLATDNPVAINLHLEKELTAGQISGPFEKDNLKQHIGPFCTLPLGAIPKGEDDVRVILDFLYGDADHPAINDKINPNDFQLEWGSYADMVLIATNVPPGLQGATMDVDAAFCQCPVRPDQQQYFVIQWKGRFYVSHCVAFGGVICRKRGYSPVKKWVDDFVFIRSPLHGRPGTPCAFQYSLNEIIALSQRLGWPWKASKTCPFNKVYKYLGFQWSLKDRLVSIPDDKWAKYIARLSTWSSNTGVSRKQAKQVHGTLVHCSLAVPNGRLRLVSISRFASSFERAL
jgi:hypothetical protein